MNYSERESLPNKRVARNRPYACPLYAQRKMRSRHSHSNLLTNGGR